MQEMNDSAIALLLIEQYSKSLHRLNELREVSSTSSLVTIFATIKEAGEMALSVRQMERDFKKVQPEYEGDSRLAYRDWFTRFCGQDWPRYFNISASKEELKLASIPRKFRAEYASNLASIGKTLDDITRALAIVFGDENTNFEAVLRAYFKPEAKGTNDGKYNRLILPEIQALKDDGLTLKEWGAVAYILQNSKSTTPELHKKSFDAWCKEFFPLMGVSFKPSSVPRYNDSIRISESQKFARLKLCLNTITDD